MSLDVYLEDDTRMEPERWAIFIREDGEMREISRAEWDRLYPDREPVMAKIGGKTTEVYTRNITHNLNKMADAAGIYEPLWRPDEIGIEKARHLIEPLTNGLDVLRSDPEKFKKYNPENGWGNYDGLVAFVADYLDACRIYPDASVRVWR